MVFLLFGGGEVFEEKGTELVGFFENGSEGGFDEVASEGGFFDYFWELKDANEDDPGVDEGGNVPRRRFARA